MNLEIIILAAGKGTRMRSRLPKVLHQIAGRPLIEHLLDTVLALKPDKIHVISGYGGRQLRRRLQDWELHWVEQEPQLGTGDAVNRALPFVDPASTVLVLNGDVPFIARASIDELLTRADRFDLVLLSALLDNPKGYGRLVRDQQKRVQTIVEHKDASTAELSINEVYTGVLLAGAGNLGSWLSQLNNDNKQGEYYLTDVVDIARRNNSAIDAVPARSEAEILGINSQQDLARAERLFQRDLADRLMDAGLNLVDPKRFDLRGRLDHGVDCAIDINVVLEGDNTLGDGVRIGANCLIRDCRLGDRVTVEANSVLEQAEVDSDCVIGPFARLRPGTRLQTGVKVGNFVEIKNSSIQSKSKVNHLSYVGDSELGSGVNIGAGVITCNYDGANKHRTVIGDDAFIGSNCALVAPLNIGAGATIGAGSTISRDAPANKLTVERSTQSTLTKWRRPKKS